MDYLDLMKKLKVLYLGLDPKNWITDKELIHYPVIQTHRIDSEELFKALKIWDRFTHVIFTSKRSVKHLLEVRDFDFSKIKVISIGRGTEAFLKSFGIESLVAPQATQEGVIELLKSLSLKGAYLFIPKSKRARPKLIEYLKARNACYLSPDLYVTVFQRAEPFPKLQDFSEIVFTSPSTVEGFLKIYKKLPKEIQLTAIGPITQKAIDDS